MRSLALAAAVAAVVPMLAAAMPPPAYTGKVWSPFPVTSTPSVPGTPLSPAAGAAARQRAERAATAAASGANAARASMYKPLRHPVWPAAGTSTVKLSTTRAGLHLTAATGSARPGGLAVRVTEMKGKDSLADRPGEVSVNLAAQAASAQAGISGLLMSVAPVSGTGGLVSVQVSDKPVAKDFGGGWASRLRLVELPACALRTPGAARCRAEQVLPGVNNAAAGTVSGTVALPAAPTAALPGLSDWTTRALAPQAGLTALALVAGPSGATGNFAATPLKPSGTWASQQGDFTYSYPVSVPPSLGSQAPQVALSYDAQSIDTETSASNTQGGWIGDGWDYTPGFIERSYQPCSKDGITGSGDLCWDGYNATLSLGSLSGVLVGSGPGTWKLQNDNGTTVQLLTGAPNGLWNGEYWLVTTPDGTKYYFGQNHLPGGNGADPASGSAWGEPVYSPGTSDPCHAAAECQMGWRWNLDYVVDPAKNLTEYAYQQETNYYSMGGGQNNGNGTLTQYVRGGFLTKISYGWLLPDAIAGAAPAADVVFKSSQRCTGSASECSSYSNLSSADASDWPDTPFDQICASTGTCTNYSPSFFSTYMLTSITTQVLESAGTSNVSTWTLAQSFPQGGVSNAVIFLNSITQTGDAGGSTALPPTTFTNQEIDNRVDGLVPAATPVIRPRITGIKSPSGAGITVVYDLPQCSRVNGTMPSSEAGNKMSCFPVYWTPPGETQIEDWFNKSLVASVDVSDQTGADSIDQHTAYTYLGGAAWHYNDNPLVPSAQRTWDQYRGFAQVEVTTGDSPDPVTETMYTYMRGMDGDNNGSGGTKAVTVTDPNGDPAVTDSNWLSGEILETDTYTALGSGTVYQKAINGPWTYTQTDDITQPGGLPDLTAHMLSVSDAKTLQLISGTTTYRTSTTATYYNGIGQVTAADSDPSGGPETCTSTAYATPPSGNTMMEDYPKEVTDVAGAYTAGACPAKSAADIITDTEDFYDGGPAATITSMGTLGTLAYPGGLVTGVTKAVTYTGTTETFQPQSASRHDAYGRVTWSEDGNLNITATAYTPAYTAGATTMLPTEVDVTAPSPAPSTWTNLTKTSLVQALQRPARITDPNGEITTETYDPLGRVLTVTLPADQSSGEATYTYAYSMPQTSPASVATQTLRENGSYASTVQIYDGMLQLRQVQQTPANAASGRLITDTSYDSHGWTVQTSQPYYDSTTAPGSTLFVAEDGEVPAQTVTVYDGMGRPTASKFYSLGQFQWQTATAYPGAGETDVTPPAGGTATSTFTNALGQTTATWDYTTAAPDGNAAHADVTSYTYTSAGQVATVADNAGNTWTYGYNLLGEKTSSTDPGTTGTAGPSGHAGTSTYAYDPDGNLTSTTSPSGQELSYKYDGLSRKTAEYSGTTSGTQLAAWGYDQAFLNGSTTVKTLGQPSSSTSYTAGASGPAYTQTITGYNTAYQPTGTKTTIPATGGAPAGTYTTSSVYTPLTGLLSNTAYGADGGLPAETVNYSYDLMGLLAASGGTAPYLDTDIYSAQGQIQRTTFGPYGDQLVQTYNNDQATGRLLQATTSLQTLSAAADTTGYTYSQAGDLTSSSDVQNTGGTNTQCYTYNNLQELTAAWTDKGGTTTAATPSVPGIGACTDTAPTAASLGGPAQYWDTYSYNLLGGRTSEVTYNSAGNITQTTAYAGNGTTPAAQPNAATSITTGPGTATVTAAPGYDPNGDTTSTTTTGTTNPLISGVQPSSGTLCLGDSGGLTTPGNKIDIFACNGTAGQDIAVNTNGTLGVVGSCIDVSGNGTAANTAVVLEPCSTSTAGEIWHAGPGGSWVNPNSGKCLADPGNTTTNSTQLEIQACATGTTGQNWASEQIRYNPQGQISSIITPTGITDQTSSYIYDADGNLLVQEDPAQITYYADGGAEQIIYNTSAKTTSGLRFYSAPDGTTTVRSSTGTISYETANQQNTSLEAIAASNDAITRRYYDPYGNKLTSPAWPDSNSSFLGKPQDPATSLDLLGARQYNPATGSFLSLDPLFEAGSPLEMGGYAYAADNPVTQSDPTGTHLAPEPGTPCTTSTTAACTTQTTQQNASGNTCDFDGCPGYPSGPGPATSQTTTSTAQGPPPVTYTGLPDVNWGSISHLGPMCFGPGPGCGSVGGGNAIAFLAIAAAALTVINVLQLGADPVTDVAEGADIAALSADTGASLLPGMTQEAASLPESLASEPDTVMKVLLANGDNIGDATRGIVATTAVPYVPAAIASSPLVAGSGDLVTAAVAIAMVVARLAGMVGN